MKECAAGAEAREEGEEGKREGGMRRWLEVKSLPVHQLPRRDRSQEEKKPVSKSAFGYEKMWEAWKRGETD